MIRKRGPVYWLDIRIRGRRIRKSLGTDEHGLALERARDIKEKLLNDPARSDITWEAFTARYLEWAWANKPASAQMDKYRLELLAPWMKAHNVAHLADFTPWHAEQLKIQLKAEDKSPTTINRYLQLLRGLFYRAIDWELFAGQNPIKKIRFFKEAPARRLLTPDEIMKVLTAAKDIGAEPGSPLQKAFADMITLAMNTGLRKSELLDLRWNDIGHEGLHVIGKGQRARTVPLNAEARAVIRRQPRRADKIFDLPNRDRGSVFRRTTEAITKKTGVPFHFHLLRHVFTSRLLAAGVDIRTLAEILGHSPKQMTTLLYSHTTPALKQRAVDVLLQGEVGTKEDTRQKDVSRGDRRKLQKRKVPLA